MVLETTTKWMGKPYLNDNEEQAVNDFMYKQWASTKLHKSMGCYSIKN